MFTCVICHFEVELDDVVARQSSERCICLRCFSRETGNTRPMPKGLRRQVIALLDGLGVASS